MAQLDWKLIDESPFEVKAMKFIPLPVEVLCILPPPSLKSLTYFTSHSMAVDVLAIGLATWHIFQMPKRYPNRPANL